MYLGYCGTLREAIQPIRARPRDVNGVPTVRKTFNCLVVGAQGSGKSSFLNAFIGANVQVESKDQVQSAAKGSGMRASTMLRESRSVVKAIKERDSKNKERYSVQYLALTEVPEELITSGSLFESENAGLLSKCDAIIYIFESNDGEQVDFVKKAASRFDELEGFKFVPSILL